LHAFISNDIPKKAKKILKDLIEAFVSEYSDASITVGQILTVYFLWSFENGKEIFPLSNQGGFALELLRVCGLGGRQTKPSISVYFQEFCVRTYRKKQIFAATFCLYSFLPQVIICPSIIGSNFIIINRHDVVPHH
jgi:hypothetical protein